MKKILFLICFSFYIFADFFDDVIPSSPGEIASLNSDFLIEGIVSTLSGQLVFSEKDLHVRGAQDLIFKRSYLSPQICGKYDDNENKDKIILAGKINPFKSQGWKISPHLWVGYNFNSKYFQLINPNGFVLEFEIKGIKGILKTSALGCCNLLNGEPSSFGDIRNIKFLVEDNQIKIICPDGTKRIYDIITTMRCRLNHEILPNGKVIRYEYNENGLSGISATDITGKYIYAHINQIDEKQYKGSDGREFKYEYEKLTIGGKLSQKKKSSKGNLPNKRYSSFRLITKFSNPYYSNIIKYNDRSLLEYYDFKKYPISCSYTKELGQIARVKTFSTSSGTISFSYDSPIAGEKGGFTTAIYPNGKRVIYRFSKLLLLESVENWYEGKLYNQKTFKYDERQHLSKMEITDGNRQILVTKEYICDEYGNPILEKTIGDFGTFSIKKAFSKNRVISEKRDDGLAFEYSYLKETHLITSKITYMNDEQVRKTMYKYDEAYNLIEEKEEGKSVTKYYLYNNGKHLHRIKCEKKKGWEGNLIYKIEFFYDSFGNISKEKHYGSDNIFAYAIERKYDEKGNLLEESNPLGQKAVYDYDLRSRQIKEIPFSQKLIIDKTYDDKGRLILLKEGEHKTRFAYNAMDELIQKTDYLNLTTNYIYHPIHSRSISIIDDFTSKEFTYDFFGREVRTKDAYGAVTQTKYNSYGDPLEIIYPEGGKEIFSYDTNGLLIEKIDPDGLKFTFTYDPLGRVISQKEGDFETTYIYDSYNLIEEIDPLGISTKYTYNLEGQKIKEKRDYRVSKFTYDYLGYLASEKRADRKISYKNDVMGRLLEKNIDDLIIIKYTYDQSGNIATISKKEPIYFYYYDAYDRMIEKEDAFGAKTKIFYIESDKLLIKRTIDPRGNEKIETYNPYNQLLKKEIPGVYSEKFSYDKNLRLKTHDHLSYTYNLDGLEMSITESGKKSTFWTYTPAGKIKTKQKSDGTIIEYKYDINGNLIKMGSRGFEYDALGRLIAGTGFKRELDSFGNIIKEKLSNDLTIASTYDAWNRPQVRTLPDKSEISYFYEGPFLKLIIRRDIFGHVLYFHSYDEYDENGFILKETNLFTTDYIYDKLGRKVHQKSPFFEEEIKYDLSGNVIQKGISHFSYDDANQLIKESDKFILKYDNHYNCIFKNGVDIKIDELNQREDIDYDLKGNLIRQGFVYDEFNQLIKIGNESYFYDALGRRIQSGNTSYFYIDNEEIGCFQDGKIKELKVLGNGASIAIEIDGKPYATSVDIQKTIRQLIDFKTGKVAFENTCDAFGRGINFYIPYAYMGKRYDKSTGFIYFGKRFYDPETLRWISQDPIGPLGHSNLYQYLYNNPYGYLDPDGRFAFAIPVISWVLGSVVAPVILPAIGATAAVAVIAWAGCEIVQALNNIYEKNIDVYSPDRPLPLDDKHHRPVPETDAPHTELGIRKGSKGDYPQAREFDENGIPIRDIDFTDHGYSDHPIPHQHRPQPNPSGGTPKRGPPEPLPIWSFQ